MNAPCRICTQATIDYEGPANEPDSFEEHHLIAFVDRPDLELDPTNLAPTHSRCNRSLGRNTNRPGLGERDEEY